MTERAPNRPGKAEPWPKQCRKLTMHLNPSDKIFFRSVNARGIPAGVGAVNAGKACTVIIGHKEIEGLQKVRSFRDLEEFAGSSVEILPEDLVFSCSVDSVGAPYSVGKENKGNDVTIIVFGTEEETQKAADKVFDDKLKVIDDDLDRIQTEMNKMQAEQDALLKDFREMKKHD